MITQIEAAEEAAREYGAVFRKKWGEVYDASPAVGDGPCAWSGQAELDARRGFHLRREVRLSPEVQEAHARAASAHARAGLAWGVGEARWEEVTFY